MCARYILLNYDVTITLTEALENIHPEEELSLSDIFLKVMDTSSKAHFDVEEQLNKYDIFKSIEESVLTQTTDAEIKRL